jgi:hypothetical protein
VVLELGESRIKFNGSEEMARQWWCILGNNDIVAASLLGVLAVSADHRPSGRLTRLTDIT